MITREKIVNDVISQLREKRNELDSAIGILEETLKSYAPRKKRKKIIESLPKKDKPKDATQKGFVYDKKKNPHWTQLPKNKKRVQAMALKRAQMNKGKRTKKKV